MAFEVRCKTPFGPFSSPELLDLKAPPAVHTAQSRIAAWNKEHNLDVAEHVNTRQPIKGRAGPAQYEVHYSSRLSTWCSYVRHTPASTTSGCRLCCKRYSSALALCTYLPTSPATSVLYVTLLSSSSCCRQAFFVRCRYSQSTTGH